jgi:hypothetical protein
VMVSFSENEMKEWAAKVSPDYMNLVLDAYNNKKDINIQNSDMDHAELLSYLLIEKAEKNLRILTGKFKEIFYGDGKIKEAIKKALDRGVNVDVVSSSKPECNEVVVEFKNCQKGNFNMSYFKKKSNMNHFLVVDSAAFRIEDVHTDNDLKKRNVRGVVNFNNSIVGHNLAEFFDNIVKKEIRVTI